MHIFLRVIGASVLVACGGMTTAASDGGSGPVAAEMFVTTGADEDTFIAEFQPYTNQPSQAGACDGATAILGPCCAFPPPRPPPLLEPDGGSGGSPIPESNAGQLTLFDATSNTTIASFSDTHELLPQNYSSGRWQPGDTLTVSATGDELAAFSISAVALIPPAPSFPTSLDPSNTLAIGWQPDPNAETMTISFDGSGAIVECTVPDAQGQVTFDPSLFTGFTSGEFLQASSTRSTTRSMATSSGQVVFESIGWGSVTDVRVK